MSNMPEKIWADDDHWIDYAPTRSDRLRASGEYVAYTRDDLIPSMIETALAAERAKVARLEGRLAASEAKAEKLEAALVKINVGEGWAAKIAREALIEEGHEPS